MKKITGFLALLLCLAMLMAGCSGNAADETASEPDESAETETGTTLTRGEYTASDYCTITDYKGLKFSEADIAATDEEVQTEVDTLLANAQTLEEISEDRAVEEGDVVNIDYTGYLNDEAFDGGTGTGYDLEIGSGSFISGFEDGLVGAKKGDEVSLDLTFPDPYPNNTDLAGQAVVFKVTINSIQKYVTPEYTDEFVAANTSYDTIEAYEQSIRDDIREDNLTEALANKLLENAEFAEEYPESLVNYYRQTYINYYDSWFQYVYQTTLDEYLESQDTDIDTFLNDAFGEDIDQAIREDLVLGAVAEAEGIKAEGDDYEAYLEEQTETYSKTEEELYEAYGEDVVKNAYISDRAYSVIYDSIVVE